MTPHVGFRSFHRLVRSLRPRFLIHGHIHPDGHHPHDFDMGTTAVINAVGHRIVEVERR